MRHGDAAVRVASAGELAPLAVRPVHQVGPVGEGGHERDGEPVAHRLAQAGLVLDVVRHVREGVALRLAALVADGLVAAGEADRLEAEEVDDLRIVQRELDDAAHLLVVDAVHDGGHRHDVHARLVQVVDGLQLHVERIAHLAVRVGCIADAVELQIDVAQARLVRGLAELLRLGELDAVAGRLHAGVAHLARVGHGVQEVRAQRRLAAGELHAHLPLGLHRHGVVQHGLDLVPRQLMHKADLVGVHEAGVAHHVAAVGQVDGQHRAASVGHRGRAVVVQARVVVRADVAAGEDLFQVTHERRVDRHHVLEVAVDGAVLHHQDLSVALDDLRLQLADLLVQQDLVGQLAVHDLLADLRHALRTQRVRGARPAQRRLLLLVALQQRLVAPLGRKAGAIGEQRVEFAVDNPSALGGLDHNSLEYLCALCHVMFSPEGMPIGTGPGLSHPGA